MINDKCSRCGRRTNYLMGLNECMRCYQAYSHLTPPEGLKIYKYFIDTIAESNPMVQSVEWVEKL